MTGPRAGELSTEYRAICVYALKPGDPRCGEPATVHVMVDCEEYGTVALAACGAHRSIARAAGAPVDEHVFAGYCGMPGTIWMFPPVSACIIDDSGVEPACVAVVDYAEL